MTNTSRKTSALGKVGGVLFLLAFAAIWGGITGAFDYTLIRDMQRQSLARAFPTVPGKVIESRVSVTRTGKSTTYQPVVRYWYRVNGHAYESNLVRFGTWGFNGRRSAEVIVSARPVGSLVTVYYNPARLSEAILEPGVHGGDWFMLLFLLPFNLIAAGILYGMLLACIRRGRVPMAGGARIIDRGLVEALRLPRYTPISTALLAGLITWIAVIVSVSFSGGAVISLSGAILAWEVTIGAPGIIFVLARLRAAGGRYDLVIDPMSRRLTLPMTFGRKVPIELGFADVRAIEIEEKRNTDSEGNTSCTYLPTIIYCDAQGIEQRATLAKSGSQTCAESLAAWVRKKLGVNESGGRRNISCAA